MAERTHARFAKHDVHQRVYEQYVRDAYAGREFRVPRGAGRRPTLVPGLSISNADLWTMARTEAEKQAHMFARKEAGACS